MGKWASEALQKSYRNNSTFLVHAVRCQQAQAAHKWQFITIRSQQSRVLPHAPGRHAKEALWGEKME